MNAPVPLDALRAALGADAVEEHAPLEIEGAKLGVTLRPADGESLARALAELGAAQLPALVRGSGSRLAAGNLLRGAQMVLATERLEGIEVLDRDEGVCRVRAGTPIAALRAAAHEAGCELPLDAPERGATVGGALASAALGPRSHRFGAPRDVVLGLDVALASGELTHCGGRVVKNVTGYDLNKLYTGSFGGFGVIAAAWLRLRPLPERVEVFEAGDGDLAAACRAGIAIARRATTRAVALECGRSRAPRLVIELAGDAPSVARDAAWLASEHAATPGEESALERVRERQAQAGVGSDASALRFRIAALPSALASTLTRLLALDAELLAYPGVNAVWASLPCGDAAAVEAAFHEVAATAAAARGAFACESAPVWAKAQRDVFGVSDPERALVRALKQQYDPAGLLNPGRLAGHV